MTIQNGINKQVVYKKELVAWGTKAVAAGGRYLRRVTSDIDLDKDTYESNEIATHGQVSDFRHGTHRVGGSINGELSPGSYLELVQSALRRDFTTIANITTVTLTVAVGSVLNGIQTYTITRGAGNWYTDGVRNGVVITITTGLANVANINKNLLVLSMTSATVIVVVPLNGSSMAAEGPTSSTVVTPGKITYVPSTGHTNDSYTFEHVYADITQSEQFLGCRINTLDLSLPPTGITTIAIGVVGRSMDTGTAGYFTTPTASSTKGVVAAVNGFLRVGSIPVSNVTGLTMKVDNGMTTGQVVGSNYTPDVFRGRTRVTGQFTAYFDTVANRDAFLNETETSICGAFATGSGALADFITFTAPRVKLGSAKKDDGEKGLILTCPFQALYNSAGAATNGDENTTLFVHDSNSTMA